MPGLPPVAPTIEILEPRDVADDTAPLRATEVWVAGEKLLTTGPVQVHAGDTDANVTLVVVNALCAWPRPAESELDAAMLPQQPTEYGGTLVELFHHLRCAPERSMLQAGSIVPACIGVRVGRQFIMVADTGAWPLTVVDSVCTDSLARTSGSEFTVRVRLPLIARRVILDTRVQFAQGGRVAAGGPVVC